MRYLGDGTQVQPWNSLMFYTYTAHVAWNVSLQCCLCAYLLTISSSSSMAFPICSVMLLLEKFLTGLIWTFWFGVTNLPLSGQDRTRRTFRVSDYYLCWWGCFRLVLQLCKPLKTMAYMKLVYVTAIWHVGHQNCGFEHWIHPYLFHPAICIYWST